MWIAKIGRQNENKTKGKKNKWYYRVFHALTRIHPGEWDAEIFWILRYKRLILATTLDTDN